MVIRILLPLFFLLTIQYCYAQQRYAVRFTDKNNSPYSITNPIQFLSQKAIDRRTKHSISITLEDIPVNKNYLDSVEAKGAVVYNKSKWMNLAVIKVSDTTIIPSIVNLPFVSSVEVIKRHDTLVSSRIDNKLSYETIDNLDYGYAFDQISIMHGDFLHEMGYQGEGKVIAVLDAGFTNVNSISAFSHLWNDNRILGYWDFINNNDSIFDKHNHGTAVLSTMAGNKPGELLGTAPMASYWLLRTEDGASETISEEYNWLAAVEFADSAGVDVINSSLGYTTFNDPSQNHTYADLDGNTTVITRAADLAFSKGMLVVNSAGNSGSQPWYYISAPADGNNVLAVAATEHDGSYASFSSRGPSFDGRIKPNVATIGRQSAVVNSSGNVVYSNGTSFASPEMAGMAAVLWQAFPDKSNKEIFEAIQKSAHQYNFPDDKLGFGIPNFRVAYMSLAGLNINDPDENQILKLYPQPFNNEFTLLFYSAKPQTLDLRIVDVNGKLVYDYNWTVNEKLFESLTISTSLASGIYHLQLIDEDGKATSRKIIKQ